MRKVMRPRYYCEHCNKGGGSSYHMQKHEKGCTLNPRRVCGMCNHTGGGASLAELMEILPPKDAQTRNDYNDAGQVNYEYFVEIPEETIKKLREAAEGCPACMMAALRQRGLPVHTATGFNFTEECKQVWAMVNEEQARLIGPVY